MPTTVATNPITPETRRRLLEAAGEVFAERGFRAATIREICQRAGANVAAIHYHYGDKETLYTAVLKFWHGVAQQKYPPSVEDDPAAPAEQRLRVFVRTFMQRMLDAGRPAWHGQLIAREMVEPTNALKRLIDDVFQPQLETLTAIMRALLVGPVSRAQLRLCAWSIFGQCLFYRHSRVVIDRMQPEQKFDAEEIERLADHITEFSLGALKELARKNARVAR